MAPIPKASIKAGLTLSVDAMGGDSGPATVVAGLARFLRDHADARAILKAL